MLMLFLSDILMWIVSLIKTQLQANTQSSYQKYPQLVFWAWAWQARIKVQWGGCRAVEQSSNLRWSRGTIPLGPQSNHDSRCPGLNKAFLSAGELHRHFWFHATKPQYFFFFPEHIWIKREFAQILLSIWDLKYKIPSYSGLQRPHFPSFLKANSHILTPAAVSKISSVPPQNPILPHIAWKELIPGNWCIFSWL